MKITSITVSGLRWFDKSNGNTYHSVAVHAIGTETTFYAVSDETYGYGEQYVRTAFEILEDEGLVSLERYDNGMEQPPWRYCEENGIKLQTNVLDVQRRKMLHPHASREYEPTKA